MKYYSGKHLEPDHVYIKPEFRNNGIGKQLNGWLVQYARQQGCEAIELNCYMENEGGQRFWQDNGYNVIGLHYSKTMN